MAAFRLPAFSIIPSICDVHACGVVHLHMCMRACMCRGSLVVVPRGQPALGACAASRACVVWSLRGCSCVVRYEYESDVGTVVERGASLQSIAVRRCSRFGITARLLVDESQRCQCCVACCKVVPYVRPGASDLSHALARAVRNGRPWPDGSPKTEPNHATGHQFSQSVHPSQATSTTGKPRREATQAGNPREGPHGAIRPRATQPPAATTEKNYNGFAGALVGQGSAWH